MARRVTRVKFVGDDKVHEFVRNKEEENTSVRRPRRCKVKLSKSVQDSPEPVSPPLFINDSGSESEKENEFTGIKPGKVYSDEEDENLFAQNVYTFCSRRRSGMVKKAVEVAEARTPKSERRKSSKSGGKDETKKSILKKQTRNSRKSSSVSTPRHSKRLETNTPYRLRARNTEEAGSSDDSAASEDEEKNEEEDDDDDDDEDDEEEEEEEEIVDTETMDVKKESVIERKKNVAPSMAELVEEYFHITGDKSATSDRTLAKLPRLDTKSLMEIVSHLPSTYKEERLALYRQYVTYFNKWMFQLCNGRNILLHGLGSKRPLLDLFCTKLLSDYTHLVVNGFFPSLTLKHILMSIAEDILGIEDGGQSLNELQNKIIRHYNKEKDEDLFLVINNLDGSMIRGEKAQSALSYLAQVDNIHIIASVDHINAPLIWDQAKCSRFQWIWYDVTTFEPYSEETSYENSLLVQQSGVLALSSLRHVMSSLTPNAKQIFYLLVHYQTEHGDTSSYIGLSFPDLYQKCREAFLVNSNLTLKAQLTEFRDHKLIRSRKGNDGTEHLSIPLDDVTLKEFMENQEDH